MELAEIYNAVMKIQNQLELIYTGQKVLFAMVSALIIYNIMKSIFGD